MTKYILIFLQIIGLLAAWNGASAQALVSGTVVSNDSPNQPLVGATVQWKNSSVGVFTNDKGYFSITKIPGFDTLIVHYIGFQPFELVVTSSASNLLVKLKTNSALNEIVVESKVQTSKYVETETRQLQNIGQKELGKAACCNLSESFETNPSVDVNFADAISGTKKIRLLGLDGVYALITTENIPAIRGLSSNYGLTSIPGAWIESIQLAKGVGSVVNGYEAITGQINVELRKPEYAPSYYANVYVNAFGRLETSVNHALRLNKKWSSMLMVHGNTQPIKYDGNGDGFRDIPTGQQINLFNKWKYSGDKVEAQIGVKYLSDNRTGGDMRFTPGQKISVDLPYGVYIDQQRMDVFAKCGTLPTENHPHRSVGIIANYTYFDQWALYGLKDYSGKQNYFYTNLIFQDVIKHRKKHGIKFGGGVVADSYLEHFQDKLHRGDTLLSRDERIIGCFSEYTYHPNERFSLVSGMRIDYHNLAGLVYTPRLHMRYKLKRNVSWRFSGGKGFRYANVLIENNRALVSSKKIIISSKLLPERVWNVGTSLSWDFKVKKRLITANTDLYYTWFINRIIMDMDSDHRFVSFTNLNGNSYALVWQTEIEAEITKRIDIRVSQKWQEVKGTISGELREMPFVSKNILLGNMSYTTKNDRFVADFTATYNTSIRLPDLHGEPAEYAWTERGQSFWKLNCQITYKLKGAEFYVGSENMTNFKQKNPIIAVDEPYSQYFNAGNTWGPIVGRVIYTGIKFSIR